MLEILRSSQGCAAFASTQGDLEAHRYKAILMDVFREAGWDVRDAKTFMFFGVRTGIVVTIPFGAPEEGTPQAVMQSLAMTGETLAGNHGDLANDCGFYVQIWHAADPSTPTGSP